MEQKYIKASDVAKKFGVTRQTIRNWIDKGFLASVKLDNCLYVTMESVKAIEDKFSEIIVVDSAVEAYLQKYQVACDEYKASIELLHSASVANSEIRLSKQRLSELVNVLFGIVRVGITIRGERMIEMLLTGSDTKDVAEEFGVSPERVKQIVDKSIRILNCEGIQYQKLKEENERLKEKVQTLENNIKILSSYREPGAESLEYSKVDVQRSILTKRLVDCNLSVRALNCLKSYKENINGEWVYKDIDTIGDLARRKKTDLLRLRNFGKKCLIELDNFLDELGLEWGTNYMVNENGEVVKVEQK